MQLIQCNACGGWDTSDKMSSETFPRCSSCVAASRPVVATCSCEKAADIEREIKKQLGRRD